MFGSRRVNTITTFEDLTHQLCNFKSPALAYEVLNWCKLPRKEWLFYAYYQPESKYSRNRIRLEDNRFELFLICWKPGQGNERHGHCGSYCFFQVLHGELLEIIYEPNYEDVSSNKVYKAGQTSCGVSKRKSGSHEVKNNSSSSWAVSLHIYLKPTARNNVPGKEETIQLEYASINGKPNGTKCLRLSENREFKIEYARTKTITNFHDLIEELRNIEEPSQALQILKNCNIAREEWIPFVFYQDDPNSKYSINLIHLEDNRFKLLLICWEPGQGNEPHWHCGSCCFFQVLHGELREILYTAGNAFSKNEHVYKVGDVSWTVVLNESEWHEVKNNDSSSRAVSLHICFKPTDKNQVFGEEEPRTLEHISEKGKPKDTKCLPLSDKKRKVSSLRKRLFLIAALTSFVIALVALLLVTLTIKNEQENTVSSKSRFEICLNCSLLFLPTGHPVEREITITYSNDARDKCCVENEQELSTLMELILNAIQVRTNEELSSFTKEKLPISAHKRLMQTNLPGQDSKDTHFVLNVDPMYNDPAIEHNSGVDLVPDGFKIIYTGIYYVYSSIEFQNDQTVPVNSTHYHYTHRISPGNPSLSGVLLRMVLTVDTSSSPIRETTYAGGAFYLQSGDLIQICLSSPTKINKNSSSFMGLILLSTS